MPAVDWCHKWVIQGWWLTLKMKAKKQVQSRKGEIQTGAVCLSLFSIPCRVLLKYTLLYALELNYLVLSHVQLLFDSVLPSFIATCWCELILPFRKDFVRTPDVAFSFECSLCRWVSMNRNSSSLSFLLNLWPRICFIASYLGARSCCKGKIGEVSTTEPEAKLPSRWDLRKLRLSSIQNDERACATSLTKPNLN
jgi:hypothetical protein